MAKPTDSGTADLERFKGWFKSSRDHSHKWRMEGREQYDFVAGTQWSEDDAALMKLQQRPIVTFNRTGAIVDAVAGLEVNNRQEVRYVPRSIGRSPVNELLTGAAQWVREECNAEDEESDAFFDMLVSGMGWTETRLDYDEEPEGKLLVLRVDPLEMFWDASARRRNLADARYLFRMKDVPLNEAEDMFPDEDIEDLDAQWARDLDAESKQPHDAQWAPYYKNDQSPDMDKTRQMVRLVEVQWWEHEKQYKVTNPATRKAFKIPAAKFNELKSRADELGVPLKAAKYNTKKYYKAILGSKILSQSDGPEQGGFTYKCMTGKRDRNYGTWYGLVRAMVDPQKWANKWLAQIMYIINTNAKGGIMAEADAFENPQQAKDEWADPSAVTLMSPGAISGGKVLPKPQVQYPTGIDRMMTLAIQSMHDVTGMNPEILGMADREQPGVLEHQRKQASMSILAGMFDSLRHYRKDQGVLLLYYITNFLSDGRLVRVGGPEEAQYIPLIHQQGLAEYDVIVDDTPSNPNQKENTWGFIMQMAPILAKMQVPPQMWLEMLKYSPLPSTLVAKLGAMGAQAAQQQQGANPQLIEAQARMVEAQAKAGAAQARSQAESTKAQAEVQTERAKAAVHVMDAMGTGQQASGQQQLQEAQAFNQIAQGILAASKANAEAQTGQADAIESILSGLATVHTAVTPPAPSPQGE